MFRLTSNVNSGIGGHSPKFFWVRTFIVVFVINFCQMVVLLFCSLFVDVVLYYFFRSLSLSGILYLRRRCENQVLLVRTLLHELVPPYTSSLSKQTPVWYYEVRTPELVCLRYKAKYYQLHHGVNFLFLLRPTAGATVRRRKGTSTVIL